MTAVHSPSCLLSIARDRIRVLLLIPIYAGAAERVLCIHAKQSALRRGRHLVAVAVRSAEACWEVIRV